MNRTTRLILVAALLVAAPGASADPVSQMLVKADIDSVLSHGKIHPNWHSAVFATALERPLRFTPLSYSDGVALYRLESLETGAIEHALIEVPSDPTIEPIAELAPATPDAEAPGASLRNACVPGSPRCDLPFSTVLGHNKRCILRVYKHANFGFKLVTTDHDWHTFSGWGGNAMNDRISSIQTTCHGALFFEHQDFGGTMLAVGANTNMNVPGYMNDKISSFLHSIP